MPCIFQQNKRLINKKVKNPFWKGFFGRVLIYLVACKADRH
jgi:hypothetical protein